MKKFNKDVKDFSSGLLTLGVSTAVVARIPGASIPMAQVASFTPLMGTMVGGSAAMRAVKKLQKNNKLKY